MVHFDPTGVFEEVAEHPKLGKRKKPGISKNFWSKSFGPFFPLICHNQGDSGSHIDCECMEILPASLSSGVTWENILPSDLPACTTGGLLSEHLLNSLRVVCAGVHWEEVGLYLSHLNRWPTCNLSASDHNHGVLCHILQKVYFALFSRSRNHPFNSLRPFLHDATSSQWRAGG